MFYGLTGRITTLDNFQLQLAETSFSIYIVTALNFYPIISTFGSPKVWNTID